MSTTEKAPVPLDPFGNETCLLFLKYGKCRFGKKCKKSHILPDKNAPLMQRMPTVANDQPTAAAIKQGPKIAFSVKKTTPYSRPSSFSSQRSGTKPMATTQHTIQPKLRFAQADKTLDDTARITPSQLPKLQDTIPAIGPSSASSTQSLLPSQPPLPPRLPKVKKPAKLPSKCLLASIFQTSPDLEKTLQQHQTQNKQQTRRGKTTPAPVVASNDTSVSADKVEQWYITSKARIDPRTRKLMVLTRPTTARQRTLLKTMRKHHWECRTEIESNLKKEMPRAFELKVARDRIDWSRVAPYLTLLLQAAFDLDLHQPLLPVVGTTLCTFLEIKDLGGLECEQLLISWGLTEINARRFTSHAWEVMVAAAGESNVQGKKGVGFRIRQMEKKKDYLVLRAKLTELNQAPTRVGT